MWWIYLANLRGETTRYIPIITPLIHLAASFDTVDHSNQCISRGLQTVFIFKSCVHLWCLFVCQESKIHMSESTYARLHRSGRGYIIEKRGEIFIKVRKSCIQYGQCTAVVYIVYKLQYSCECVCELDESLSRLFKLEWGDHRPMPCNSIVSLISNPILSS